MLLHALGRREQRLRANLENDAGLETTIRDYLSPRHRDGAGTGCPTAALVAEIARHPRATRDAFTDKISEIIAPAGRADRQGVGRRTPRRRRSPPTA